MLKNYVWMSAVAMTLFSGVTLAQDYQKGLYFGINTGASFVTGQTHNTLSRGSQFEPFIIDNYINSGSTFYRDEASARGFNGGLLLGWNFYCDDQFIYSLEASANLYSNRAYQNIWNFAPTTTVVPVARYNTISFEESWDLSYSADLVFKPGYFISHSTQVFAMLGGSIAEVNTRFKRLSPAQNLPEGFTSINTLSNEDSETLYGLLVGVGLQKQISCHMSFLLSYQYTYYGRVNFGQGGTGFTVPIEGRNRDYSTYVDRSIRIDSNVFKMGFAYTL